MGILSTVPSSLKRPGSFHEFVHTPAGRGLAPITNRVALLGTKTAAGTATVEQPVQVFDALDADTKAGKGSPLALMARKALETAQLKGVSPEIWIVPIAEPGAGVAHEKTATVSGPATESGNLVIRIAGRTITVGVTNGDSAATIATALDKAIDAMAADLPVTATAAAVVVTCVHTVKGENGADVSYSLVSKPAGVNVVFANTANVGAGVIDITLALDSLVDKDYHGIAIENRKAADVTDAKTHNDVQWGVQEKRYRWVFMADTTTISAANTNSVAANTKHIVNICCEGTPSLAGEVAAAAAVAVFAKERPNANYDAEVLPLFPPAAASAFTNSEIESLLASGTTPLVPTPEGDRLQVVRLCTTKTTEGGAPFEALFDLAPSRTAAFMAKQYDAAYQVGFKQELLTTDPNNANNVLKRIRDVVIEKQRAAEALEYIQNVDTYLAQLLVEKAGAPVGRVLVSAPIEVVSPLHQTVFIHTTYL